MSLAINNVQSGFFRTGSYLAELLGHLLPVLAVAGGLLVIETWVLGLDGGQT